MKTDEGIETGRFERPEDPEGRLMLGLLLCLVIFVASLIFS